MKTKYIKINNGGTIVKSNKKFPWLKRLIYEIKSGVKHNFQISKKEYKEN